MLPKYITFTGFDDRTNISDMINLSEKYPIEWGVLISPTNRDSRFPSIQAINELIKCNLYLSLHCCGGFSKKVQKNSFNDFPIKDFKQWKKVQLNGKQYESNETLLRISNVLGVDFILQKRNEFLKYNDGIIQLFDASGGKGIFPESIPESPDFFVGYAGGMCPENVLTYINMIKSNNYYIDMETGVRTNGWFDLKKVDKVCKLVYS